MLFIRPILPFSCRKLFPTLYSSIDKYETQKEKVALILKPMFLIALESFPNRSATFSFSGKKEKTHVSQN